MNQKLVERLKAADLTGERLADLFSHLEIAMQQAQAGQLVLTLAYVSPEDILQEGDMIPSINIVLTQYQKDERPGD